MRHKFLVLTVKKWLKSVHIYGSYHKIKPAFLDRSVQSKKTKNRTDIRYLKKPIPKTEPTLKKTDQKTENRHRLKKPTPTHD